MINIIEKLLQIINRQRRSNVNIRIKNTRNAKGNAQNK